MKLFMSLCVFILVLIMVFQLVVPSREGPWDESQAVLPKVVIDNGVLQVDGVRDFKYKSDGQIDQKHYLEKHYNLASLKTVWYGLSHFSENGFAHAFLSFEFESSQGEKAFLVSSIEARLNPDQNYHPIKGLFRAYNRMMVLATERDVIGLRTHHRKEKVFLYPLKLSSEQRLGLIHSVMADAQAIYHAPDFYNTALDNCITGILQYSKQWQSFFIRFDYRVILPGFSDELAYQYQYIDGEGSLDELRERAKVVVHDEHFPGNDFSNHIRRGWQASLD